VARPEKVKEVEELSEVFQKAKSAILTDYKGINAPDLSMLRRYLKDRSIEFRITKNTLARLAAKNTPFELLDGDFKGPVSLIVSYEDAVAPAKALADFEKSDAKKKPVIIGGVVDGKKFGPEQVKALAHLPSREVLLSQMLSVFQGPTTNFVGVFNSLLRKLVGTLDAVREKKASSG